eukprot:TRINITY_DN724_c0_g1_i22.p1 TRINITY_DN724_c0_g1~~TRINITY_DN724_c0_g1_i22.p1  ORF type:complete len:346 (+),score=35.83 TRINITY_DN724_c0_g1_i22:567-1604(+)
MCNSSAFVDHTLVMTSQSVVSSVHESAHPTRRALVFLPLNGSTPFSPRINFIPTVGSNGESLVAVISTGFIGLHYGHYLEVRDNDGTLRQRLGPLPGFLPQVAAVSKRLRNPSSSSYYTAVSYFGVPSVVTVYDSNGETVAKHTLPDYTHFKRMKFRDEDNSLVLAGTDRTIVYNIKTGAKTTFYRRYRGTHSVAFNADGSKMAVYVRPNPYRAETPHVYIEDLYTGDVQRLCTVDGDTGVSFATDGQGRSVVLTYSQKDSSASMRVSVFNVPDVTNVPATPTPPTNAPSDSSAPIGAIIGGVLGGVALLVAAGVGFWLWKKRQAAPKTDRECLATAHTQDYHTM